MSDQFYLQDSRSYVGNDVLWWAIDGAGYTTDLRRAQVFSKEAAVRQHECRESDIPWPKDYIDARTRPAVDMQYIKRDEALKGTGITIIKPKRAKKERHNCGHCGSFMSERQRYLGCPQCGGDNAP